MLVPAREIMGLGPVPGTKPACLAWLKRHGVSPVVDGNSFLFPLSALPEDVRRAYTDRVARSHDLDPGTYDEAAHAALNGATPLLRQEAERKAEIARFIIAGRKAGLGRSAIHRAVWERFGTEGNSAKSLDRWEAQVQGVDPVNFAPALLDGYKGGAPRADMSEEAWRLFLQGVKAAFQTHRYMALYRDVKAIAAREGWLWPSYPTVMRRFKALPMAEQVALRFGREEAQRRFYQANMRDASGLRAMEWVVLDGRTVDVWVVWPDGQVIRPTVLGLVDQASGFVLDIEFAPSENAQALAALEVRTFAKYGAPDNLLTDNGAAFSGHIHAGQVGHKHRNKGNRRRDLEPPGLHKHLGFNLHFALPRNAKAKLMERKFADMSREIDTGPEFARAHTGSNPGERPEGNKVPVPFDLFEAVYRAKIEAYNAQKGRRSDGCKASGTSSYADAFKALQRGRIKRTVSPAQLRLATMEWTLATVQRDGRVSGKDGWKYGEDLEDGSQDTLLRFVGRKVWVGTNPLDRSEPAVVWNPEDDRLIHGAVHAVKRGAFDDAEGARMAARKKAHVRKMTKKVEEIDAAAAQATFAAFYVGQGAETGAEEDRLIQPNFKRTVRPPRAPDTGDGALIALPKGKSFITPEMRENQRRAALSGRDG